MLALLFFVVYQQLENYLLAPRIMRRPVQLSPAAVLLAGLIGGAAMGLIGALMAIPITAGIRVVLSERLHVRDAADADAAALGDGEMAPQPGQVPAHTPPHAAARPAGVPWCPAAHDGMADREIMPNGSRAVARCLAAELYGVA